MLDPSRTVPGDLAPALLRSPSLRWDTATERRRVSGRVATSLRVALVHAGGRESAGLAAALASRCSLDVPDVDALVRPGAAAGYDCVVVLLGGSAADAAVLRAARRLPAVLWLRSLALAEPHRAEAAAGAAPGPALAAALRRCYADRAPRPLLQRLDGGDASAFDAAAERRYGLLLTAEVVREAHAVVVSSAADARRLRLDLGPRARVPSVTVIDPADDSAAAAALLALLSTLAGS
jgi:hypothetical protein